VLDCLQPPSALEELIIWGFSGVRFPVWLGNQYMFRLSNLELKACQNCKELPSLGQLPCLKHLSINSLTSIKYVGRMFSSCEDTNFRDWIQHQQSISFVGDTEIYRHGLLGEMG
jgi:hypothetical protein